MATGMGTGMGMEREDPCRLITRIRDDPVVPPITMITLILITPVRVGDKGRACFRERIWGIYLPVGPGGRGSSERARRSWNGIDLWNLEARGMRRIPSGSESPSLIALSRSRLIFREGIVDYSFSFFLLPTIDPDLGIRSRGIGTRFHSLCVSADIALRKRWRGRSGICDSSVFRFSFLSLLIWISIRISIWLNGYGRSRWISRRLYRIGCIGLSYKETVYLRGTHFEEGLA
jgi:hypothetical protein